MTTAPVILFAFNRPYHTWLTMCALSQNKLASETNVIAFVDTPKKSEQVKSNQQVVEIISSIKGFKNVTIHKRETNYGLSRNIIDGVSQVINESGKAIILEDDLVTSPAFLTYMNEALIKYENNHEVISIHGYVYPVKENLPETFFLKGADCWGWATWKRGWDLFEPDGKKLLDALTETKQFKNFNFNNSYDYKKMLQKQVEGANDSWAIRWNAAAFLLNKLTLYPGKSLVQNIGLDASGTHSKHDEHFVHQQLNYKVPMLSEEIIQNEEAYLAFSYFFNQLDSNTKKLITKLKNLIK